MSVDPVTTTDASSGAPAHSYGTHLKHNIHKLKVHTNGNITYLIVQSSNTEPTSHILHPFLFYLSSARSFFN
jgi:hypothetical protein